MKIECPETESTMELSDCLCGPKCEHYYDTKQHRIDELESAMQEFVDSIEQSKTQANQVAILKVYRDKFERLLK